MIRIIDNYLEDFSSNIITKEELKNDFQTNPYAKYILYFEKNEIIGYIYYSEIYDRVEINQFEVKKIHRSRGIGSKLLKKLIEAVDKSITLEVKKDNYKAINLYKKFNFEEVAIRKGYYKGVDGILMQRIKQDSK